MADQQRWFKLWCTAPYDDHLQRLSVGDRWAWVVLGTYTKAHGTHGSVALSATNAALAAAMGIPVTDLVTTVARLPHLTVSENGHGDFTVTWTHWYKYQDDTTHAERKRRARSKKRGEERRRDKEETTPLSPLPEKAQQPPIRDQARAVLAFLNEKTSRHYRDSDTNLRMIEARLRAGATLQDCKSIIARKWREWGTDPKMTSYVRPATLFNATKFEQYRGEIG